MKKLFSLLLLGVVSFAAYKTFEKLTSPPVFETTFKNGNPHLSQAPQQLSKFQQQCERQLPPTSVRVVAQEAPVQEINTEGILDLTAKRGYVGANSFTLGLTTGGYQLKVSSVLNTLTFGNSATCARPTLNVVLSVPLHVVSIAKEVPPGSCLYGVLREHEYRHVAVNQKSLQWAKSVIEAEMKEFFKNQVYYGNTAEMRAQINQAIQNHWIPRTQNLYAEVQQHQLEIDTPDEYARVGRECNGEANRIMHATPGLARR